MTELTIDSVSTKGPIYPMLINFQNGYPNEDFESKCSIIQENGTKTIATELDELVYYGKEENEDLGKTLILARDRKTGKVRLIEVGCAELIPYRKVDLNASQQETSRLELSRKFGSKKQKKQMEQREKLKVNVQTVTKQMENVTANITVDQLDLSKYNKNDSEDFYVPPIDRDATKVEDVYPVEKIMSEEEYENIYTELKQEKYEEYYHPYIKALVKGRTLSHELTVLAVYTSELLKFIQVGCMEIKKKNFRICNFSNTLNNVALKNFTEFTNASNKVRTRPTHMKDKLTCHIMVFVLILHNFKVELEPLCAAVKMSPRTQPCINKIRLIGAYMVHTEGGKMVQLKLPLAPKTSFIRRKSTKF
ncbi:DNA-directed RNA polymerase I subunit RPA49-like [Cydia strobilella]|uniref:DNA-directed RNA polymerase I subunit RPA49-like n=1 Tax=Cydia strobilella TaxID=1100964 RepID=UPI003005907C